MKMEKLSLLVAISLGLAGAKAQETCTPGAATPVYLTGSTAFRAATISAIEACVSNEWYEAYGESTTLPPGLSAKQTVSHYINIYGHLTNDGSCIIVKCDFSGSEAGYNDLTHCTTKLELFLNTDASWPTANVDSTSPPGAGTTNDTHLVDIAMADNTQPFAQFLSRTPAQINCCIAGIIPFKWVKNAQTLADQANADWIRFTNVTKAQLRTLSADPNASMIAAQFTGNPSDTSHYVYLAGRDNQSGTRANFLLDLYDPVVQSINQVLISGSAPNPTLTYDGNLGQSSGGTLATTMKITGSLSTADPIHVGKTGWMAIAYLGVQDAVSAEGGGATDLTLNGVAESTAAIREGEYSYFGYENCCLANCDTLSSEAGLLWTCMCGKYASVVTDPYEIAYATMNAIKGSFGTPDVIKDSADPVHR
jgi:hypothetical protein